MNLEGKKLLILGGVTLSCEIVREAQKHGVKVLVTDYIKDSPAKKIADQSFMVSTTDVDSVVDLIRQENVDGVLTGFLDSMLPYYQKICEKAALPCYGTAEQFEITTHKEKFKSLCNQFGVPVVDEYHLTYPFLQEELDELTFPVLVKPVDYSGARGVIICEDQASLIRNYERSLQFSPSKTVLVERYMNSKEATIFYLCQDGQITLAAMADRHVKNRNAEIIPLPVAYTFPAKYLEQYQQNLNAKVMDMFKSIGIQNGLIFIQTFVENGDCVFYEMGYRLTGTLEYKVIHKLTGLNPLEMMINFALTGSMYPAPIRPLLDPNHKRWACNITFLAKPGKIGKILGMDEVRAFDNIIDVVPAYAEGDTIPASATGTLKQVVVRVFADTNTRESLAALMDKVHRTIQVLSPEGKDMLLEKFDTRTWLLE